MLKNKRIKFHYAEIYISFDILSPIQLFDAILLNNLAVVGRQACRKG